jgi:asparagine synthase (glutamine-hydrolysing)
MVDDTLPNGELVRRGYVRRDYVDKLISDDRAGRADYSKEIWHLLTMDHWFARHRCGGTLVDQAPVGAAASL